MVQFQKMNGAGNDFVLLDNRGHTLRLTPEQIARLCDRHRGVGADGVLLVEPAEHGADYRMRYYNRDGGEAEMCGNGARCFARYVRRLDDALGEQISFETPAGVIHARFEGAQVRIKMGTPRDVKLNQVVTALGQTLTVHSIDTGVPHAVVELEDLEQLDVRGMGRAIREHEAFAPRGTNVNFLKRVGENAAEVRTYERGVEDETLACGTGVTACALILSLLYELAPPVDVRVRGGDVLAVDFSRSADDFMDVFLIGPADFVFAGEIEV